MENLLNHIIRLESLKNTSYLLETKGDVSTEEVFRRKMKKENQVRPVG